MKKAVKRGKSKTKTKTKTKSKTQVQDGQVHIEACGRQVEGQENDKSEDGPKSEEDDTPPAGTKLKHVAKKAATAAVVAAGLAALDTALGELNPKKSGSDASASDKSEPKR